MKKLFFYKVTLLEDTSTLFLQISEWLKRGTKV